MSPTWPESQASRPSARQKVFFRSPPTASAAGTSKGRSSGSGAWPRERRTGDSTPSTTRLTESSHGTWIPRSCASHASARPASRCRASASSTTIGSPDRFPLVITSATGPGVSPGRPRSRWCRGVAGSITPRSPLPGATAAGHAGVRPPAGEDDGPGQAGEQAALRAVQGDQVGGVLEGADHERERLVAALLALAQRGHGRRTGGVADQVVAADPLDRHHRAGGDQAPGLGQRCLVVRRVAARPRQREPRPAGGAADRLRVEAAVRGVGVLRGAGLAEGEAGHRRGGPVVGERGGDGEPRAAVGAGDERVPVAAVARVEQVAEAVVADRDVGGDEGAAARVLGVLDGEGGAADRRQVLDGHVGDPRQRRSVPGDAVAEGCEVGLASLHLDDHAVGGVPHRAGQVEVAGQRVDVGTEPHALHHAVHAHPPPAAGHECGRSRHRHIASPWCVWLSGGPVGGNPPRSGPPGYEAVVQVASSFWLSSNLRLADSGRHTRYRIRGKARRNKVDTEMVEN